MNEIETYLNEVDEKRQAAFKKLFDVVQRNIPEGFELGYSYGMIGFDVPLSTYPEGYLGRKDEPVPFIGLAAQKRHIALYHMGIMGNQPLLDWFTEEYAKVVPTKLNMGKSCIRFTTTKNIPYELIGELVSKMTLEEYMTNYKKFIARKKTK